MFRKELLEIKDFTVMRGTPRAKMDQNESPFPFPEDVMDEILKEFSLASVNRYMRPSAGDVLRSRLSEYCGVEAQNIAPGAGADSLIHTLIEIFAGSGGSVFHTEPSYPIYGLFADICGCGKSISKLNEEDFSLDREDVEARVSQSNVAFFTYPNNPTGNLHDRDFILHLADRYPDCHIVADEAYYEYTGETFVREALVRDNMTVLRTFSKHFSIPSLRLGYAVTSSETAGMIRKCQFEPYNISLFSAIAGRVILERRGAFEQAKETVGHEREKIFEGLSGVNGLKVFPGRANFLFMKDENSRSLAQKLFDKGIFIRDYSQIRGYDGYLRVTVGTPEENELFISAVQEIMTGSD